MLLDDIIADSRWDMTYLGMQIMVEGLALAAFGMAHADHPGPAAQAAPPLRDERRGPPRRLRRALAAGVLRRASPTAELLERQEFAFEAAVRMRDRFLQQEVWERMGVDPQGGHPALRRPATRTRTRSSSCCSPRSCPNCKKLGLLDANDGWLRKRFDTLGVTQFEDWADTGEEYLELDAVTADRRAAAG